ncbi:hypothetical protein DKM19_19925 [Streptosporangium sp. 'caverna']|nr:hypothetical protein DKM19_19925 [Streptosporangium sp. 'caverna']
MVIVTHVNVLLQVPLTTSFDRMHATDQARHSGLCHEMRTCWEEPTGPIIPEGFQEPETMGVHP